MKNFFSDENCNNRKESPCNTQKASPLGNEMVFYD